MRITYQEIITVIYLNILICTVCTNDSKKSRNNVLFINYFDLSKKKLN